MQNHLLQVLALVAMEPPVGNSADDVNDKKAEVFRAMPALDPKRCVRGQYRGYTDIAGVQKDSQTETFIALRTEIDNWRWAGVPIFLRAGKGLPERVTEVRLFLHRVPRLAFLPEHRPADANQIVLRIDPEPGLRLQLSARVGDAWHDVHLDSSFAADLGEPEGPYELLLHAALTGDHQLFAREDSIEETWRIVAVAARQALRNPAVRTRVLGTRGRAVAAARSPAVGKSRGFLRARQDSKETGARCSWE